jgi:hypothetical protein
MTPALSRILACVPENAASIHVYSGSQLEAWLQEASGDEALEKNRRPIPNQPARSDGQRPPVHSKVRSKVEPRDIPPNKTARRLHLTLEEFRAKLPELLTRGFPAPDPTTGMYDLKAIDTWADSRNPRIFQDIETDKKDARQVVNDRLQRFHGNKHGTG